MSDKFYRLIQGDNRVFLPTLADNSIDCIVTDPQYGISFMGKDWDKALPDKVSFQECFRVLKHGGLAFVMSSPRQDVLWRMMALLEGVGFELKQSPIYWTYASGFPKAYDMSLGIDHRFIREKFIAEHGRKPTKEEMKALIKEKRKPREIEPFGREGRSSPIKGFDGYSGGLIDKPTITVSEPSSEEAKKWDGWKSITGLKPAVEVILMVNKPKEGSYVDNVLKHGVGAMNIDACRIPFSSDSPKDLARSSQGFTSKSEIYHNNPKYEISSESGNQKGRFPANLLVSDDVLDTSFDKGTKPHRVYGNVDKYSGWGSITKKQGEIVNYGDVGGFSRYFSLDAWWRERVKLLPVEVQRVFPFLVVSKASRSEKEEGLDSLEAKRFGRSGGARQKVREGKDEYLQSHRIGLNRITRIKNIHPTVKPLKLMSYLVELGCPTGGVVLDPFVGQGSTLVSSFLMGKSCIAVEMEKEYCLIADTKMKYFTKRSTEQKGLFKTDYVFEVGQR